MALSTYTELQAAVRDELDASTSSIPDSKIVDSIALAEGKINRRARFRNMEQLANATYAAGTDSIEDRRIELPDNFIEMISLSIKPIAAVDTEYREIVYCDPSSLSDFYDRSMMRYTVRKQIEFSMKVSSDHKVRMHFLKAWRLATNSSNWLLTNYPDVYFYGALAECEPYMRNDQRVPMWKAQFDEGIDELNKLDERNRDDAELSTSQLAGMFDRGSFNVVTG